MQYHLREVQQVQNHQDRAGKKAKYCSFSLLFLLKLILFQKELTSKPSNLIIKGTRPFLGTVSRALVLLQRTLAIQLKA